MIADEEREFFQRIAQIFYQSHYNISTPLLGCGGCFDLVAKKDVFLLLVKLLTNIDSLREEQAYELKKLALMLSASPLIVGKKIRKSNDIEDGVVYSRYDIPAISKETLRNLLINHLPPLIYTHRGGYKVKVNGELLKEKRLEMGMSLNELARKVGVTKRAIYEYERGTSDISVDTAIRIEECLDEPLTMAINLLDQINQIGSIKEPTSSSNQPKNELERQVKRRFDSIGLRDQLWTKKTPFRVLARPESAGQEPQTRFNTTITGITKKLQGSDVVKKIHITYSISKIAEANPLVVVGRETPEKEIEGVPVVSIDNLTKLDKKRKAA